MKFKVFNFVPGVKVDITQDGAEEYSIAVMKEKMRRLSEVSPGSKVKIGDREYIVLEHLEHFTAVISKDFVTTMEFGGSNDYRESAVRKYLNTEFLKELVDAVGAENIPFHEVDLMADDGTGKEISCRDHVSLLTTDRYRKYREFLPDYGKWWWTATRISTALKDYFRLVCCVNSSGTLGVNGCDGSSGVRPFFFLNSSIFVS